MTTLQQAQPLHIEAKYIAQLPDNCGNVRLTEYNGQAVFATDIGTYIINQEDKLERVLLQPESRK